MFSTYGMYTIYHIVYLIIVVVAITLGLVLTKIKKPSEKTQNRIRKILALILLVLIITNRISITYYKMQTIADYKWYFVFPSTWCSFVALVYALVLLFGNKNNVILNCVVYVGLLGGILAILIPSFLTTQGFFDVRSLTGLIHHSIMIFLSLFLLQTKYYTPTFKGSIFFVIGMYIIMLIGLFEIYVLGYSDAMQVKSSLVSSSNWFITFITSWYMAILGGFLVSSITGIIYEKRSLKHTYKEIFLLNNKKKN